MSCVKWMECIHAFECILFLVHWLMCEKVIMKRSENPSKYLLLLFTQHFSLVKWFKRGKQHISSKEQTVSLDSIKIVIPIITLNSYCWCCGKCIHHSYRSKQWNKHHFKGFSLRHYLMHSFSTLLHLSFSYCLL